MLLISGCEHEKEAVEDKPLSSDHKRLMVDEQLLPPRFPFTQRWREQEDKEREGERKLFKKNQLRSQVAMHKVNGRGVRS